MVLDWPVVPRLIVSTNPAVHHGVEACHQATQFHDPGGSLDCKRGGHWGVAFQGCVRSFFIIPWLNPASLVPERRPTPLGCADCLKSLYPRKVTATKGNKCKLAAACVGEHQAPHRLVNIRRCTLQQRPAVIFLRTQGIVRPLQHKGRPICWAACVCAVCPQLFSGWTAV